MLFKQYDAKLIPLNTHTKGIAEYLYCRNNLHEQEANWFWMASNIQAISYDGVRKDDAFMICRPAFEYEDQKQDLHSNIVYDLTIFLYVYSGFEAILNASNHKKCPSSRGKINAAKWYIKTNFSNFQRSLPHYQESIALLRQLIDQKDSVFQDLIKYLTLDNCTDINGVGIKIVYKIRNLLTHGSFLFPQPVGHSYMLPVQSEIISLSTRIVLLTKQMVLIANCQNEFNKIELWNSEVIDRDENTDCEWEVGELKFLRSFHLIKNDYYKNQLLLDI